MHVIPAIGQRWRVDNDQFKVNYIIEILSFCSIPDREAHCQVIYTIGIGKMLNPKNNVAFRGINPEVHISPQKESDSNFVLTYLPNQNQTNPLDKVV